MSGLLWAMYHSEYVVVSDKIGWGVVGQQPLILLHDAPSSRRLLEDLGLEVKPVTKPYGCLTDSGPKDVADATDDEVRRVVVKKMLPWDVLRTAEDAGVAIDVKVPFGLPREWTYLDVDVNALVDLMVPRTFVKQFVVEVDEEAFWTRDGKMYRYEHLVSTIPAPVFARIWRGAKISGLDRLNYLPATFVSSEKRPANLDRWCALYDARSDSVACRVGLVQSLAQYEVTGRVDEDSPEVQSLSPASGGVFVNPFARIFGKGGLKAPKNVTFLGRFAEWDHRVTIDKVLDKIYAWREEAVACR